MGTRSPSAHIWPGVFPVKSLGTTALRLHRYRHQYHTHQSRSPVCCRLLLVVSHVNPFRTPEPLPILNTSNLVPKNGFPVVKGLTHEIKSGVSQDRTGSSRSGVDEHPGKRKPPQQNMDRCGTYRRFRKTAPLLESILCWEKGVGRVGGDP